MADWASATERRIRRAAGGGQVTCLREDGERVVAATLTRGDVGQPDQVRGDPGRLAQLPAQPGGLRQPLAGQVQLAGRVGRDAQVPQVGRGEGLVCRGSGPSVSVGG